MGDKLKDKVAIVTGAGTGIGKAIAIAFAKEGAHIVGAARRVERLRETAAEVKSLGRKFLAIRCDVVKKEDCENVARETAKEFGRIDILVNNAAIMPVKPFLEITSEEWDAVMATNLKGIVQMCQAVLPYMLQQKRGKILMVNSSQARIGSTFQVHYAASKGALISLTRCLATEFGPKGIYVNGWCCGFTPETEGAMASIEPALRDKIEAAVLRQIPLRRLGRPEDYQGIAVFLASEDSDYITGQTISVDGGATMP